MRAYRGKFIAFAGAVLVTFVIGLFAAGAAHADAAKAKKEMDQKVKEAMENFDLLEYEEARKLLSTALTIAKKNNLEKDPAVAQVHLRLGIVYFSGLNDAESAKLSFLNAVEIDATVQIEAAYRTGEMVKLLDDARAEVSGVPATPELPVGDGTGAAGGDGTGAAGGDAAGGIVDCATVTGIQHTIQDNAEAGADKELSAYVGPDIAPAKVSILYRPQGSVEFQEAKMTADGQCRFVGSIPAAAMNGGLVHYYVAAYNQAGKVLASKGSSGSPNIVEIAGGSTVSTGAEENPLAAGGGLKRGGEVIPAKPAKVFVSIALGTGGGYVSGETEQVRNPVGCCFAPALLHVFPEVGYYLSPQNSISVAARIGFPLGANRTGHATAAPAGVVRFRHALSPTGNGLVLSGALGAGFIRNTVKLTMSEPGQDVDTTLTGPLIIGGGAAWAKALGGTLRFVAELNALAGIPIISEMGTCTADETETGCLRPNFGVQFDLNLGIVFGF